MTAQSGNLVLIKIGNGAIPEVFNTVGGLRTNAISVAHQAMATNTVEAGAWQQIQSGAGMLSFHISGSGVFTDSAAEEKLRANAFSANVGNYQFCFANGDYVQGPFVITSYQRSGDYGAEEMFAIAMESAGAISFTAG